MFLLKMFGTNKKAMDELNKWGASVYKEAYDRYSEMASKESENVLKIFDDWWNGKCVCTEEYESRYTKDENRKAGDIIMEAVSNGFG